MTVKSIESSSRQTPSETSGLVMLLMLLAILTAVTLLTV